MANVSKIVKLAKELEEAQGAVERLEGELETEIGAPTKRGKKKSAKKKKAVRRRGRPKGAAKKKKKAGKRGRPKGSTNKKAKPIVLVGKTLTFDSGGISLKPGKGMGWMRYDKCGGMAVLAAMQMISRMSVKVPVVGILGAAENMPG